MSEYNDPLFSCRGGPSRTGTCIKRLSFKCQSSTRAASHLCAASRCAHYEACKELLRCCGSITRRKKRQISTSRCSRIRRERARRTATSDARGVADDEARSRKATQGIYRKVTMTCLRFMFLLCKTFQACAVATTKSDV